MLFWKNITPGPDPPAVVHAIIEIPKFSDKKYELSKKTNLLLLDRVLHSSVVYPQDYGFIPGTLSLDGDPVDILLMMNTPTHPMTLVKARPVGALIMEDEKGLDEKILAVAMEDPYFRTFEDIDDVPAHFLEEIREFFRTYKNLEGDKFSEIKEWLHAGDARRIIQESIDRFRQAHGEVATVDPW